MVLTEDNTIRSPLTSKKKTLLWYMPHLKSQTVP